MIGSFLDKTLTHARSTNVKDATGGNVPTYSNIHTNVKCTVYPASAKTVREFARDDMVVDSEIVTDDDIASREKDRITIDGVHYIVVGYRPYVNSAFGDPVYVTVASKRNQ